jgi:hypothetical protein
MHDAKNATEKMNGFQLAGRALRVEVCPAPLFFQFARMNR